MNQDNVCEGCGPFFQPYQKILCQSSGCLLVNETDQRLTRYLINVKPDPVPSIKKYSNVKPDPGYYDPGYYSKKNFQGKISPA